MVRLAVHVTPRAARDEVAGWRGSELAVRVRAVPDKGAANRSVCEIVANRLGVARTSVRVVAGQASRHKLLDVDGVDAQALAEEFGGPTKPAED